MADDITPKPADQVSAGGTAQPADQAGIIDALRSRGPAPQAALQNIMQPSPGPNMGSAFGSGVLGALAGNPGSNPYLTQQAQQQKDSFYQQLNAQRAQDQRADRELRHNEATLKILRDTLGDLPDTDPARGPLARQYAGMISKLIPGVPAGPLAAGLVQGQIPKEKMGQILDMLDAGVAPDMISNTVGVSLQNVQRVAGIANSESARKALGFQTKAERQAKLAEEQKKSLDLARESWGLTAKDPRTPFVMKYAMDTYGKSFSELTRDQQREVVEKSQVLAQRAPASTTLIKNALAEFNPGGDPNDPNVVKAAVNAYRAKRQKEGLDRAAVSGQLNVVGRQYSAELGRVNQNLDKLRTLDNLVSDMDRLITEGRALGLSDNPKAINAVQQELAHWTGGPKSKAAQWYEAWNTIDARFATVAQSIEQITGNRLAQQNVQRAMGFHPKRSDPYGTQLRVLAELKRAAQAARQAADDDLARTMRQYQGAAGAAGVPFIVGGHEGGVESVEEEQ